MVYGLKATIQLNITTFRNETSRRQLVPNRLKIKNGAKYTHTREDETSRHARGAARARTSVFCPLYYLMLKLGSTRSLQSVDYIQAGGVDFRTAESWFSGKYARKHIPTTSNNIPSPPPPRK